MASLRLFLHLIPKNLTRTLTLLLFSTATCLTRALPPSQRTLLPPSPSGPPIPPLTAARGILPGQAFLLCSGSSAWYSRGTAWAGPSQAREVRAHPDSPAPTPPPQRGLPWPPSTGPPALQPLLTAQRFSPHGGRFFVWGQSDPVHGRVPCLSTLPGT